MASRKYDASLDEEKFDSNRTEQDFSSIFHSEDDIQQHKEENLTYIDQTKQIDSSNLGFRPSEELPNEENLGRDLNDPNDSIIEFTEQRIQHLEKKLSKRRRRGNITTSVKKKKTSAKNSVKIHFKNMIIASNEMQSMKEAIDTLISKYNLEMIESQTLPKKINRKEVKTFLDGINEINSISIERVRNLCSGNNIIINEEDFKPSVDCKKIKNLASKMPMFMNRIARLYYKRYAVNCIWTGKIRISHEPTISVIQNQLRGICNPEYLKFNKRLLSDET
eukprot:TRINITY_DN22735_c0_g1_i1.p1 TRINITY_DN22735_c0_g1~~TRINITY_DN22735_c0_g1_i1.p1  ORF type:complete len:278 (+),score=27.21 TRINITY_DN22735_c0_g1_i1:99-932(+)